MLVWGGAGGGHSARSSPGFLPRLGRSICCGVSWIGGRLRRAAIAESACVLHTRFVSSTALTTQAASLHSSAGLGGSSAGEPGSTQPFLPVRGGGLSPTPEHPGQSGDRRQHERNCRRHHEWAVHAVTVRVDVDCSVSGAQVGSFVALLFRALRMGSEQGFLWSLTVDSGRRWWAFDGPETAQKRTLTAHRRPRNGPRLIVFSHAGLC